jgi:hypothetical protein
MIEAVNLPLVLKKNADGARIEETTVPAAPFYVIADNPTFTKVMGTRIIDVFPCGDELQAGLVLKYATATPYEERAADRYRARPPADDRVLVIFSPEDVRAWEEFGASRLLSSP